MRWRWPMPHAIVIKEDLIVIKEDLFAMGVPQ